MTFNNALYPEIKNERMGAFTYELITMKMTYSYKPIFLLALFTCADNEGNARIQDIVHYFIRFYEERRNRKLTGERSNSVFAQKKPSFESARNTIIANPLRVFLEKKFILFDKGKEIVSFIPEIKNFLDADFLSFAVNCCEDALTRYFARRDPEANTKEEERQQNSAPYKNIVFDTDNVLYSFDPYYYAKKYIQEPDDQLLIVNELFQSIEWVQMQRGIIDEEELSNAVCRRLPNRLHAGVDTILQNWYKDLPAVPGMGELIWELKIQGCQLYMAGNNHKCFHEYSLNLPASDAFDGYFISADYGLLMPEQQFFLMLCQELSINAGESVFINHSPINAEASLNIGFNPILFHNSIKRLRQCLQR